MSRRGAMGLMALLLCVLQVSGALAASFDDAGVLRLVNRDETITKNYKPEDLVLPAVETNKKGQKEKIYMRPVAARALEEMFAAAKNEAGYNLLAVSGYRSFGEQQLMFKNKVAAVGSKEKAWRKVAPAGASEHQLGLAMDIVSDQFRNLNSGFGETDEGKWLYANCHRFGFIVRYRKEWEDITGYAAEPWHFRYLGVSHACAVQWLNVPYETYAHQAMELPEFVLEKGNAYLLYALMDSALNGDGCLFDDMCNSNYQTEAEQDAAIREMTSYCLPDGVTLEMALNNEVLPNVVPAR